MTIVFIIVASLTLLVSNKKTKSTEATINNKKDSFIYLGILAVSISFDLITAKIPNFSIGITLYGIIGISEVIFFIIINSKREKEIEKIHSLKRQVVQCLAPVRRGNELDKDLENNIEEDLGFQFKFDSNGELEEIMCDIDDPGKWTDDIITRIVFNLNKFIPIKQWVSSPDFPKLECSFIGTKLPPDIAKYPGSFLRPINYIPLGVNGVGEIGWNLGANKKNIGESLFKYKDGGSAETIIPSKAPQALIGGSTGGGKAIFIDQNVRIFRRDINKS